MTPRNMAARTGDPFIDAVYRGIPTIPVNKTVRVGPGGVFWETAPVWGTFLALAVVVLPLFGYVLYQEHRQGKL